MQCPVAHAIMRAYGYKIAGSVTVSRGAILMPDKGTGDVPESVKEFITRFDNGGWVEPFEFELSLREGVAE
jgi:hypothetical protein